MSKLYGHGYNSWGTITPDYAFHGGLTQVGTDEWKSISTGESASSVLGVKTDGTLWAWGSNGGSLPLGGDTAYKSAPTQVGVATDWDKVFMRGVYGMAIKTDGSLWWWGWDWRAGMGDASLYVNVPTPHSVLTGSWRMAAVHGGDSGLAIKADNTLWGWGQNRNNCLGLSTYVVDVGEWSAIQVSSDSWLDVSIGEDAVVGIKQDGTMWSWGSAQGGLIGDGVDRGGTSQTAGTIQIGTGHTWLQASSAGWHKAAIRSDGTLWTWGYNDQGALGTGDLANRAALTQVGTDNTWVFVDTSYWGTFALKQDGTLWGCGDNGYWAMNGVDEYVQITTMTQVATGGVPLEYIEMGSYTGDVVLALAGAGAPAPTYFWTNVRRATETPA